MFVWIREAILAHVSDGCKCCGVCVKGRRGKVQVQNASSPATVFSTSAAPSQLTYSFHVHSLPLALASRIVLISKSERSTCNTEEDLAF